MPGDGLGDTLSALYDEMLSDWRRVAVQVTTQAQVRTEVVWFNFAPERMHWASHAGRNAAERLLFVTLFRWNPTVFDRTIPSTDCLG